MSDDDPDIRKRLEHLERRLKEADLRNLSLIFQIERLISMNNLREDIVSGSDKGRKIHDVLGDLWNEIAGGIENGS